MRFEKTPYHLRYSIEQIMADARKNITVHYIHNLVQSVWKSWMRSGSWCQIVDNNDYGKYFYEPNKYQMKSESVIRCFDQRSTHQNALIAIKKWEDTLMDFLLNPVRIRFENEKTHSIPVTGWAVKISEPSQKSRFSRAHRMGVVR